MSAGDLTPGRRAAAGSSYPDLGRGEYALSVRAEGVLDGPRPRRGMIAAVLPIGEFVHLAVAEGPSPVDARTWGFTEHEDGSLSLHPSVNLHPVADRPGWHGFLERGVWREV